MDRITPFISLQEGNAEDAVRFWVDLFPNSEIRAITRVPGDDSKVLVIGFVLNGQEFAALNGGLPHPLNPSISFVIHCDSQEEIDRYWSALSEGGEAMACGWVTDRFGVSWQVVPRGLMQRLGHPDHERVNRVMQAVWQMGKLDMAELDAAFGEGG